MIVLLNKPFDVLSQFTDAKSPTKRQTLSDFVDTPHVYPAGRLDRDSEGLMVLTDDGQLQAKISSPKFKTPKTYFAQVEGVIDQKAVEALQNGVVLKDGRTRPAKAMRVDEPDWLWPRNPPLRVRKSIPDSWVKLTINEGKNRLVRRMTAAVGFPTLRLIRFSVGDWSIEGMSIGQSRLLS